MSQIFPAIVFRAAKLLLCCNGDGWPSTLAASACVMRLFSSHRSKPINSRALKEIRVRDATGAYPVIYLATRPEAVYGLHCFQKMTQKTRKADIELAAGRFARMGD